MQFLKDISGKKVYAGGSSSVNIRENNTVNSKIIGNITAGSLMGTSTGYVYQDIDNRTDWWYEIKDSKSKIGYVREDVATFTAPAKVPSTGNSTSNTTNSNNSDDQEVVYNSTEKNSFPGWAKVAIIISILLIGVSIYFLVKRKHK